MSLEINKPKRIKDRAFLDSFKDMRCLVCGRTGPVGHHVKSKGSGGSDEPSNLMPLCVIHHREIHVSMNIFVNKYQSARNWLLANGWQFEESRNKWVHYE